MDTPGEVWQPASGAVSWTVLELAIEYGNVRFGRQVLDNQVWRHKIAEHRTSVEAAR
jgi:alkylation response protein AidB-like acyl-CoA dehydrogenase